MSRLDMEIPPGLKIVNCETKAQCCWHIVHASSNMVLGTRRSFAEAEKAAGTLTSINWKGNIRGLRSMKKVGELLRSLHSA